MTLFAKGLEPLNEFKIGQGVRLYGDLLFFAPFFIYYSQKKNPTKEDRAVMAFLGISTIVYNLNNYIKIK